MALTPLPALDVCSQVRYESAGFHAAMPGYFQARLRTRIGWLSSFTATSLPLRPQS